MTKHKTNSFLVYLPPLKLSSYQDVISMKIQRKQYNIYNYLTFQEYRYLITYVALSDPGSMHVQVSLPSIGGQWCIEMSFWQFCINPVTLGPYGKLSELYFNIPLSLNCGEKFLNGIEIFSRTGQHFNGVLTFNRQLN